MFSNSQGLRHRHHEHDHDPVSRSGATKRELTAPLLADDDGEDVVQGRLLAQGPSARSAGGIAANTPPVMVEGIEQTHNSFFCPDKTDERTVMKAVAAKTGFGFFAFKAACAFLDVLPDAMTNKLAPELSPQDRSRLHQYEATRIISFDASRTEHSSALSLLWSNCHRAKPLHSYAFGEPMVLMPKPIGGEGGAEPGKEWQSEEWKEFGFQGVDPATDFRGGGCFSLFNLVAFSTSYPTLFRRMLYEADYPLAVAGINISMMLIHMLGLTKGRTSCLATTQSKHNYSAERSKVKLGRIVLRTAEQRVRELQAGLLQQRQSHHHLHDGEAGSTSTRPQPNMDIEMERVLNEIYVVALSICHHSWMSKPTPRNIMEFNQTFPVVRTRLEQHLRGCDTLAEVILASPYPLE